MTADQIIDGILEHEGSNAPLYLDPDDAGGRTSWGISEKAHPDAWKIGPPTKDQARSIYAAQYVAPFDVLKGVVTENLRAAVVDDGVLSGVITAKLRLQQAVSAAQDGVLGPKTLAALQSSDQEDLLKQFVTLRTVFLVRKAISEPKDLKWLAGWVIRSLSFL